MEQRQFLIVGAGPTGLVLPLWLSRFGVALRIIGKAPEAGTTSRAMVVHARSVEFARQLGIADAVIEAGEKARLLEGHLDRGPFARIPFGDFGEGLSRYPFMLVLPQHGLEAMKVAFHGDFYRTIPAGVSPGVAPDAFCRGEGYPGKGPQTASLYFCTCTRARALWGLTRNLRKPRNTAKCFPTPSLHFCYPGGTASAAFPAQPSS